MKKTNKQTKSEQNYKALYSIGSTTFGSLGFLSFEVLFGENRSWLAECFLLTLFCFLA